MSYQFITTADGSPTVRFADGESMHSLKGAFSETIYIYGLAIETAFKNRWPPQILSMGLGLGYVELLASALALRDGCSDELRGESFEIIPELRDWFRAWLEGSRSVPVEFKSTYDDILNRTSQWSGVGADKIRHHLDSCLASGSWRIREALNAKTDFAEKASCICFDAFSSKSTPDLWTEEFLKNFLSSACLQHAVLSTYACTGTLKRALKSAGFAVEIRPGFSSKRDSTFAVRGLAPAPA